MIGSGLKLIFHWYVQLLMLTKSLFNSFAVVFVLWTIENNEVSSANNLAVDERPSARSFIYIKNRSGRGILNFHILIP